LLRALPEPELAAVVIVALFLNLLHQMGGVSISLYGLGVGMSLTQIGNHPRELRGLQCHYTSVQGVFYRCFS